MSLYYTCFIDFQKAFDLIDRSLLCEKLQAVGVPTAFAKVIFDVLRSLQVRVRSNECISDPFATYNGVPQGDPMSPLLYSIFTHDLPKCLGHTGVPIVNTEIKYLLYADDLVLVATSADDLQTALNELFNYCKLNKLTINIKKTKCMIFHKGRCPKSKFYIDGLEIEQCKQFTYLGIVFTTQLSSSKHVEFIISKCNTRIAYLFSQLHLKEMPLCVALDVFYIFIFPIIAFGMTVWLPDLQASPRARLNTVFTKYLKRYLGLPYCSNNAITHYLTGTTPVSQMLEENLEKAILKVTFPGDLHGLQIQTFQHDRETHYNCIPNIPSHFWMSEVLDSALPVHPESRRALLYSLLDLIHPHICKSKSFHLHPDSESCICRFCNNSAAYFHFRDCAQLKELSPCALLKKVFTCKQSH